MSEVIPEDEDRGGGGAIDPALGTPEEEPEPEHALDEEGGNGADDGGPGSRNM